MCVVQFLIGLQGDAAKPPKKHKHTRTHQASAFSSENSFCAKFGMTMRATTDYQAPLISIPNLKDMCIGFLFE